MNSFFSDICYKLLLLSNVLCNITTLNFGIQYMGIYKKQYFSESEMSFAKNSEAPVGLSKYKFTPKEVKPLAAIKRGLPNIKGVAATPNLFHRVSTKMGFGSTPALVAHIQTLAGVTDNDKILNYIDEQLNPNSIDDSIAEAQLNNGYQTLNKTRTQLYQEHFRRPDGADIDWSYRILPGRETFYATFMRATQSKKQLFEMMADFWHNHFNVYLEGFFIAPMFVNYDRDVIRANSLGNFRQMLEDVTKSTCMLRYLGNGYNNKTAPNENFARELLELHTIGAENYFGHMPWQDVPTDAQGRRTGYVEQDVVEMARALTGWSYNGANWRDFQDGNAGTGEFLYRDYWHDKDPKRVMGNNFDFNAASPLQDMQDILDMLAEHPATAEFLATKLCRRFISDNPSQAIVNQVKNSLHQNWQSSNQIKLAMEVLLKSNEFLNTWGEKIKRPFEKSASAMRQLGYTYDFDPTNERSNWHFWELNRTGQNLFYWTNPDGFPDKKAAWLGASSVMSTWRYIQWMSVFTDTNGDYYNDVVAQTISAFGAAETTANSIVNYWYERACGVPADIDVQNKLSDFMSYGDYRDPQAADDKNIHIDLTDNSWPSYNQDRLITLVSSILSTSEFNYR